MRAIFGKTVYLGNEKLMHKAYVLFNHNKIIGVTHIKPDYDVIGKYEVITPAFIDAHCHIGATRAGEPPEEDDVNDEMDSLLFQADVLDSIIMEDASFKEAIEYGVLYFLVFRGVNNLTVKRTSNWFLPFVFCLLYALSDEFHQKFTPGRKATIKDIGFDFIGMLLSFMLLSLSKL